eukprot:2668598-Prorocentrum_lima.AAC.1
MICEQGCTQHCSTDPGLAWQRSVLLITATHHSTQEGGVKWPHLCNRNCSKAAKQATACFIHSAA